ncbi:MAG: hypothetical protein D6805_00840 [Planctomycetota bacterium]|nr:MAG: hypothetical protein D6805_00840 [Planctomycetota bacterium]
MNCLPIIFQVFLGLLSERFKKVFGGTEPFFEKGSEEKSFWERVVGGTLFSKRVPLTVKKFLGSLKTFFF